MISHMVAANFQSFLYKKLLKPILFLFDPEQVHNLFLLIGRVLGSTPWSRLKVRILYRYQNAVLEQNILGMHFKNPVGLAAGFDKNGQLTNILPDVGFGFEEIGSVTGEPCAGNPKPRLWRLPKSKALLVNYGLKNDGAYNIAKRLSGKRFRFPVGISIAKTNNQTTCETPLGIADYKKAMLAFVGAGVGDYFTVNISCPNAFGGEPFSSPEKLDALLTELDAIKTTKPIFIKIACDITTLAMDELRTVVDKHRVHGFVVANLTKNRIREKINDDIPGKARGGISGKPTFASSNALIAHLYKTAGKKYIIIGLGGIFNAEDAYEKIKCGASLVQLITGMIFEGPQVIGQINKGLVRILKKDGFKNIAEAIGSTNL